MNDPVIDEIRRVRRVISSEIGPELEGLVERYAKLESQFSKPAITQRTRRTAQSNGDATSAEPSNTASQ